MSPDYDVMEWLPQRVDVDPGGCWLYRQRRVA